MIVFHVPMTRSLGPKLSALRIVLATLLFVVGCDQTGTGDSSTATTTSPSSSGSVTGLDKSTTTETASEQSTTTSAPAGTTTQPVPGGITETWHYSSRAIGREIGGRGDDFAFGGDLVAALISDSRGVAVLDLESGQEMWRRDLPEQSGRILEFAEGRLTWATYDQVGAYSVDGGSLWEHRFDDDRWPAQAVVRDDLTVVALDPTIEGDVAPPLVVQFDLSGNVVWSAELSDSRRDEGLQWGDLLLVKDGVIVQTTDALYRLEWTTGAQGFRVPFAEADHETFAVTGLLNDDGVVYAADPGDEGEILGVDAATGDIRLALQVEPNPRVVGVVEGWLVYTDETGVHGVNTETEDTWHADMPEAKAVIDDGRVIAVSPNTLAILNLNGEAQLQLTTQTQEPQPQLVTVGEVLLVPGWERTEAIDIATGQTVMTWHGESASNVLPVDERRALLGVAGDGIHLVEMP